MAHIMGGLGDLSPQGTIAIGILVGLISTSVQSLGLTLQRKSHLLEDEKDYDERKPAYRRPRWQLGMFMFVVSNLIGSTIQITTLPLPVLSTLQASGLVFNTIFATILLKEPFTRYSAIGTILTSAGAALIATFGAIGEPPHNLNQLVNLFKERSFIAWMTCTLLVAFGTILFSHGLKVYSSHKHIIKHWFKAEQSQSEPPEVPSLPQRSFSIQLPRPMQLRLSRLRLVRGLCYALISGILSAHSLLMAKSAVELIVRTIMDHDNQFNRFQSWLILLALLFFALSQLYYLHLGLRLCSTSVLYPFVFCIYNVIAILDGLIYFQQASLLSALDAGLVALGTVILLAGVLALSWRLDDSAPYDPAPQTLPPQTPLTPGMGIVRTSEDSDQSPLRPLSSSSGSGMNETSPLLGRRRRAHTLEARAVVPDPNHRDIWAELDDEESSHDFLASLPKTPSPFLRYKKPRRDSESSQAISSTSSQNQEDRARKESTGSGTRSSSAPNSAMRAGSRGSASQQGNQESNEAFAERIQSSRKPRGHTVHFAEQSRLSDQSAASRWDSSSQRKSNEDDPGGG